MARTALIVAAKRALETERSDRLFDDPYAARLAAEEIPILLQRWEKAGGDLARTRTVRTRFVAVRTRFFDDFLREKMPFARQVVILGAGLDARAFRLPWTAETQVYEVDRPAVMEYKRAILADLLPGCQRHEIAADLNQDWVAPLLQQGYQREVPTIWLLEGVLMYLTAAAVDRLLQTISDLSRAGSWLGLDCVSVRSVESGVQSQGRVRRHWRFGTDEPEQLLAKYGWTATGVQPGDAGANFGRYSQPLPPRSIPGLRRVFFMTAEKVDRF